MFFFHKMIFFRPSRNIRFCASQKIEITNKFLILKKFWFSFLSKEIILNIIFNIELLLRRTKKRHINFLNLFINVQILNQNKLGNMHLLLTDQVNGEVG